MSASEVPFGAPNIGAEEIEAVVGVLRSGWIGTGPKAAEFQRAFAEYKGAPAAVAVNSCTAALHLSLVAAGVGKGDEVITSAMTFAATANAIIYTGATPVVADIDPLTKNVDPESVAGRLTERTRAIIPVHFAGRPADMGALKALAEPRGIALIEDCAHAIEGRTRDGETGAIGDFGCFSFYATKNITAGEGGMVLARRPEDLERISRLAHHGIDRTAWKRFGDEEFRHPVVTEAGFKYNMPDIAAVLGLMQLGRIEQFLQRRVAVWERYSEAFADLPIGLPEAPEAGTRHARHLYTVEVDEERCGVSRDSFLNRLTERGIRTGVHYISLPEHTFYRERYGWLPEATPCAAQFGRQTVSLPLASGLSDDQVERVVDTVRSIVES